MPPRSLLVFRHHGGAHAHVGHGRRRPADRRDRRASMKKGHTASGAVCGASEAHAAAHGRVAQKREEAAARALLAGRATATADRGAATTVPLVAAADTPAVAQRATMGRSFAAVLASRDRSGSGAVVTSAVPVVSRTRGSDGRSITTSPPSSASSTPASSPPSSPTLTTRSLSKPAAAAAVPTPPVAPVVVAAAAAPTPAPVVVAAVPTPAPTALPTPAPVVVAAMPTPAAASPSSVVAPASPSPAAAAVPAVAPSPSTESPRRAELPLSQFLEENKEDALAREEEVLDEEDAAAQYDGEGDAEGDVSEPAAAAVEGEEAEGDAEGDDEEEEEEAAHPPALRLERMDHLLRHCRRGALVALDIDDTLITSLYHPCALVTTAGVEAFQLALRVDKRYSCLSLAVKNAHIRRLQVALQAKRLCETKTAWVIRELQESGAHVFALTARYAEMAGVTIRALRALGIDFSHSAPFPKGAIRDPDTDSLCEDGVIYTNANDKGLVLNRFLQHVTFASLLTPAAIAKRAANPPAVVGPVAGAPCEIVFVDDRLANAHSIVAGLPVARHLGVPVVSYHYMPTSEPSLAREPFPVGADDCDAVEAVVEAEVMAAHIDHFLAGHDPLTDTAIRARLRSPATPTVATASTSSSSSTRATSGASTPAAGAAAAGTTARLASILTPRSAPSAAASVPTLKI